MLLPELKEHARERGIVGIFEKEVLHGVVQTTDTIPGQLDYLAGRMGPTDEDKPDILPHSKKHAVAAWRRGKRRSSSKWRQRGSASRGGVVARACGSGDAARASGGGEAARARAAARQCEQEVALELEILAETSGLADVFNALNLREQCLGSAVQWFRELEVDTVIDLVGIPADSIAKFVHTWPAHAQKNEAARRT
jgi:hypothetical protein